MVSGRALGCFTPGTGPTRRVHRPFGMLCYAKQYHPDSKTSARGRECRVLGYSLTQKAWILLEVPTGKTFTSPHVHFCWGVFPGLRPYKAGGGADSSPAPPQPTPLPGPQSGAGMPDGTTQGPPPPDPHQGPPPLHRAHCRPISHPTMTVATMARGAMEESSRGALEEAPPFLSG